VVHSSNEVVLAIYSHGGAIRPNMVLAVSHGGDLLSENRQIGVVESARKDLLNTRRIADTLFQRFPIQRNL
jgi:hypothetical protein